MNNPGQLTTRPRRRARVRGRPATYTTYKELWEMEQRQIDIERQARECSREDLEERLCVASREVGRLHTFLLFADEMERIVERLPS